MCLSSDSISKFRLHHATSSSLLSSESDVRYRLKSKPINQSINLSTFIIIHHHPTIYLPQAGSNGISSYFPMEVVTSFSQGQHLSFCGALFLITTTTTTATTTTSTTALQHIGNSCQLEGQPNVRILPHLLAPSVLL